MSSNGAMKIKTAQPRHRLSGVDQSKKTKKRKTGSAGIAHTWEKAPPAMTGGARTYSAAIASHPAAVISKAPAGLGVIRMSGSQPAPSSALATTETRSSLVRLPSAF